VKTTKALTRNRIVLALVSLVFTVGIIEICGRLLVPAPVERMDGFESDEVLGWKLPQASRMLWRGKVAAVNALGMRGSEPNPEATISIVMIGDSSMFGDGVKDQETMPAQLAAMLGPNVDVQNAGIPGYTCWQSRIWMSRIRRSYNPDILISYNLHSDYRRASAHDRVIAATQLGPLTTTGLGRVISELSLRWRMRSGASNLSNDEYDACLRGLAEDQSKGGGKTVFMVPISDVDFQSSPLHGLAEPGPPGTRLMDYKDTMRLVAQETNSTVIEGSEAIRVAALSRQAALLDAVHPTAKGHTALATGLAGGLKTAGLLGSPDQNR
jgi:lysophospholipase L1-like esterase